MLRKVFSIHATAVEMIKQVPMKTKTFQRLVVCVSAVVLCILTGATATAQSQTNQLRIGVYDSRAVAIAYANSAEFQQSLKSVRTEYNKARDEKNDQQMKAIEARMKLSQRRAHEQGFSTGSVAGILAIIKDSLPAVAKQAGVQMIVSKWELNYQTPAVEVVDVTDDLVALFHPSEKVSGWVKGLKQRAPIPIEQITDDMD